LMDDCHFSNSRYGRTLIRGSGQKVLLQICENLSGTF
jgi:hypothetical protein